jgi:threonine dehydratase
MIVVEPHNADCVFRALRDGEPTHSDGDVNSFMACLSAGEVSPAAWLVLEQAVDDVVTISDADARATMCALADGTFGDVPLVSGESGCAPAAALVGSANIRAALGLDATSRVVLIGSEGATAPELWASVTGRSPASVACEGRQYRGNPRTDQPVNINKE